MIGAGRLSTHFLERVLPELSGREPHLRTVAIIAAALAEYARLDHAVPPRAAEMASAWRLGVRPGWRA